MTAPIHLIAKEVALAALKAHAEGRLSAQGPTPQCSYRDDSGRPCAIGAALPGELAAELGDAPIGVLVARAAVTTDDLSALVYLQRRHDKWLRGSGSEKDFLEAARRIAGVDQ